MTARSSVRKAASRPGPHLVVTANTSLHLKLFRSFLLQALLAEGYRITILSPEDAATPALCAMGCAHVPIPITRRSISVRENLHLIALFRGHFTALQPDAILSYTIKNNIFGGLAARRLGVPFLPVITGLGATFAREDMLNRIVCALYRRALRGAPRVFFLNSHDRETFLARGIVRPAQTVQLPGEGIDTEYFTPRPAPAATAGARFLYCGRLLRTKGLEHYVNAARMLRRQDPHLQFAVLGEIDPGNPDSVRKEQLDAWRKEGVVELLGQVSDVRPHIAAADCVVLPSFYPEGVPRILMEAASMARPLITTDMPGCRDTIRAGETGLLCPPDNMPALIERMRAMAALSPAARAAMGQAGRRHMQAHFTKEEVIRQICAVLADIGLPGPSAREQVPIGMP